MNIRKLALLALLGGALMAFGCGDDATENGGGGTGGDGEGGNGGAGGDIGGGPGSYTTKCQVEAMGIPVDIDVETDITVDWSGVDGEDATTSTVVRAISPILAAIAGAATLKTLDQTTTVTGATPAEIDNSQRPEDEGKPLTDFLDGETLTMETVPSVDTIDVDPGATEVSFDFANIILVVTALGEDTTISTDDCDPVEGMPIVFDLNGAGGNGGTGGTGGGTGGTGGGTGGTGGAP